METYTRTNAHMTQFNAHEAERLHAEVTLQLAAEARHAPLVAACIREAGLAAGQTQEDALPLADAAGRIFGHLAQTELAGRAMRVLWSGDASAGRVDLVVPGRGSALHGHRRLYGAHPPEEPAAKGAYRSLSDHLALAIALGQLDRFETALEKINITRLTMVREKTYPEDTAQAALPGACRFESLRPPLPEEAPLIIHRARTKYAGEHLPAAFRSPARIADRLRRGETHALAAICANGDICGALFWEKLGSRCVACRGPYVFTEGEECAAALVEGMLHALAREQVVCLANLSPTPDFPAAAWERAGWLSVPRGGGKTARQDVYLRMMIEDPGCAVWAHADLSAHLRAEYERLALPRELRTPPPAEAHAEAVLCAAYESSENRVTLRPLAAGAEMSARLAEHVSLLSGYGVGAVRFALDLGVPWEAAWAPALLENAFLPALILPYAGDGDVLLFDRDPQAESAR